MSRKPHIPAPRMTRWAAFLIAGALATVWIIALTATRFLGVY